MLARSVLALLCSSVVANTATASDFWDAVRTPGLSTYRARLRAAEAALADNRPVDALEAADSAVALIENRADAHVVRGSALAAVARPRDALDAFERAVELDPAALDPWYRGYVAVTTAMTLGELEWATATLTRMLATSSEAETRGATLALQGDVLQAQGVSHIPTALLTYRDALRSAPETPRAVLGLALALFRAGEERSALELLGDLDLQRAALAAWPLPAGEREAREALLALAHGDAAAAARSWEASAQRSTAWRTHATRHARPGGGFAP